MTNSSLKKSTWDWWDSSGCKLLATKSDDPSLVLRTHLVDGRIEASQLSTDFHDKCAPPSEINGKQWFVSPTPVITSSPTAPSSEGLGLPEPAAISHIIHTNRQWHATTPLQSSVASTVLTWTWKVLRYWSAHCTPHSRLLNHQTGRSWPTLPPFIFAYVAS